MKLIRISTVAAAVLIAALALTACGAGGLGKTPGPGVPSTPAAPVEPSAPVVEESPEPEVPTFESVRTAAVEASGLTAEGYAAVEGLVASADTSNRDAFFADIATAEAQAGKPVVVVNRWSCPGTGVPFWGVTGALLGGVPPTCGTGYQASFDAAYAKMLERAAGKGWAAEDYVLVVVDYLAKALPRAA